MSRPASIAPSTALPPPARADHPVRDVLLVLMFVVPLCIAGLGAWLNRDLDTLGHEKRRTHPWPTLSDQTGLRAFTTAFERAFNDRFGGRELLARVHNGIEARVLWTSPVPNVMMGRNDWLYWIGEDAKSLDRHFRGVVPLRVPLDTIVEDLHRRHDALAKRGIPYVFVVVPDKFTIYPEHLPPWVRRAARTPLDELRETLATRGHLRFVDLRPALEAAKPDRLLYYLTDSHWNFVGAATSYEVIMREVQRALPGRMGAIAPVRWPPYVRGEDRYSGDLGAFLGVRWFFREDDVAPFWKVLVDAPNRCAQRVATPPHLAGLDVEVYECGRAELPTAVVYRDSMGIALMPLISENFRRIVWIVNRGFDPAIIDAERPDIVIQETVERGIDEMPQFNAR